MKLSIVTINYNNRDGLKKTIGSVMSQTWRDFEWIIIDGGSTDGSKELIEKVSANPQSNITYWCSEPDKGVYNAMNKGVSHAYGMYLNFMNSGDCYHSIETLFDIFSQKCYESAEVFYGNYYEEQEDGTLKPKTRPKELIYTWLMHSYLNHQSTFIKTQIQKENPYDESYKINADSKLFMTLLLSGVTFKHVDLYIADFAYGGVNAQQRDLCLQEKERIIKETVPLHLQHLAEDYFAAKELEKWPTVRWVHDLCEESSLYRKVFTFIVKMMWTFGALGHRTKQDYK